LASGDERGAATDNPVVIGEDKDVREGFPGRQMTTCADWRDHNKSFDGAWLTLYCIAGHGP